MKLTMKKKLLLSFGSIIIVFVLLLTNYHRLTKKLTTNIQEQVANLGSDTDQMTGNAYNVELYSLQCRRNEKDFLLRKDLKYLTKHDDNIAKLNKYAKSILVASDKLGASEIFDQAKRILSLSSEYQNEFHRLVENQKRQGLNHQTGLQGKFRKTVHQLTDLAKQFDVTDLERNYLLLRRWEKDFVRTKKEKYKNRLLASLENHLVLLNSKKQNPTAAAEQSKAIKQYQADFNAYLLAYDTIKDSQEENTSTQQQLNANYQSMRDQAHQIESAIKSVYIKHLLENILTLRKHEKDFLLRSSKKYVGKIEKLSQQIEVSITQSRLDEKNKTALLQMLHQYQTDFLALVHARTESQTIIAKMRDAIHEIEPAVANIITLVEKDRIQNLTALDDHVTKSTGFTLMLTLIAVIASIGLAFFLANKWSKTLVNLVTTFKTVADGDFTCRSKVTSKDEIGDLSNAFNGLVENLQNVITHVVQTSHKLNTSAKEITGTAAQLSEGAASMSNQSSSVAAATEEMATNMKFMAQSSEQMTEDTNTVASSTQEMAVKLDEMAKKSEHGANIANDASVKVQDNAQRMEDLQNSANQIGSVLSVIQDIAEQTNLLALNATIEAARAGDAGKGFAVVATEVKQLASQTAQATKDISQKITAIQVSTEESIVAANEIRDVITVISEVSNELASAVQEQSVTTQDISNNIAECAKVSSSVSTSVSESAVATEEITRNIVAVDKIVKQTTDHSRQTDTAGNQLKVFAEELTDLVEQFTI